MSELTIPLLATMCRHARRVDRELALALWADFLRSSTARLRTLDFHGRGWALPELRLLAELLPDCTRCISLDLSGNELGGAGGALLARVLSQPGCLVTRLNVMHTGLTEAGARALLAITRLKTVALAPLTLYGSRQALELEVVKGQLPQQPRLHLEQGASERRAVQAIHEGELERARKLHDARRAHRLGWEANHMAWG